jgi:phage-related protein
MNREIIFYEKYFLDFYKSQDDKLKLKIKHVLELVKQVERVPEKLLKHIAGSEGLYEIRVDFHSNIYRIFCCFDLGNVIVLLNAFHKKTDKTPYSEIVKANRLKNEYFKNKKNG